MGDLYDIDHVRRGRRVLRLLLKQIGRELFFVDDRVIPRIDDQAVDETVRIAAAWLGKRSARPVSTSTEALLRDMLRRRLIEHAALIARRRGL